MIRNSLLALLLAALPLSAHAAEPAKPLKVLFLGDRGHHQPAERAVQITPVLASRGIDVTYTEDMGQLAPDTLAKYDALLVYANIDKIEPAQEKALLDYVANGGYVPLHCASYCFRNSDACVALTGAEFQRHGTGEFDTKVVVAGHPIMKGLEPFRTWDETYVHHKHNTKDRTVLQTRAEGAGEEPWTWVRTHGKGRVFYTAYGHDERTWGHPGFHDLVERGIRWATGKGEVFDSRARVVSGLPAFEYEQSAKIPLYVPKAKWGTQGEPIRTMQKPLTPAESMKHLALPPGFEAKLFVSEPEIGKPIAMAWDHRGRLWVAETVDYPNEMRPKGRGRDRIRICEDTDGDGKADKFTVFAESLSIPTSLCFARGGLIVTQAPDMLFLKDTDGDDKADTREVLFTGFGTGDTHAGPSNLRYGFDNWIYAIIGYAGFEGEVGGERHQFRQGFFRFQPDGSKLEFLRNTNNNSWGVGFSEDGLLLGSTANGCPSVYMPIPNRFYEMVRGASPRVLRNIADSFRFFPATDKVRQVDFHGGFTAAAGHALYTARTYPPVYWNATAFVTEPTGHIVATFSLYREGTDVGSHNAWNLVGSDDEWTSPIAAEVGPDGNVWVIDWYNFIVQHNPTPEGFQTGKGAAYVTPLRDKTHGRIYRIVAQGGKESANPKLDPRDPKTLIAGLKSDNQLWRMQAQRLIVERGKVDVVDDLIALVRDPAVDAIGLNTAAIHALWTLEGLGATKGKAGEAVAGALTHPSAAMRRNALASLPRDAGSAKMVVDGKLISDGDPLVRMAALLMLAESPSQAGAGGAIAEALASGMFDQDRWLPEAATAAAARNDREFLTALASHPFARPPAPSVMAIAASVAEHAARGGDASKLDDLVVALGSADPKVAEAIVGGYFRGWPAGKAVSLGEPAEKALTRVITRISPDVRGQLVVLADRWNVRSLEGFVREIASGYLANARDEARPEAERIAAARQLVEFRKTDAQAVRDLLEMVTLKTPPALANGLLAAVAGSEAKEAGKAVVEALPAMTPAVRPTALRVLLGRGEWTSALMDAIEQDKVGFTDLALDQRQNLAAHPDKDIARRAKELLAKGGGLPDADRQKVIDALSPIALRGGDVARGKEVFKQQCAKCHMHSGEGGKVGPELTGMAAHPKAELIVHILDPSRSVEGNFVQYSVATKDGRTINGLMASESKTSVDLVDVEGKTQTILREDIDDLARSKKSLMPEGFEKQVPAEGLADLLEFLTHRGKYFPLDLAKVANVVTTRGMFYGEEGEVERLIFPDWSPKIFDGVPFSLVDPQGQKVPNAVMLYGPNGTLPPKLAKSVTLPCNAPAKALHFLSGISGWGSQGASSEPTVTMIVRLKYADGKTEDHPLRDGVEFADYIAPFDVPGSKLAFKLRGQQVRYLAVWPKRMDPIAEVTLVKGPDATAPIVMAITVEAPE